MSMRTVSIRLAPSVEQAKALAEVRRTFAEACNRVSLVAAEQRVWNRVVLHHLVYYDVRAASPLGSQMVCNAIKAVADAYKVRKPKRDIEVKPSTFRSTASVHYDKRTYSIRGETVSLNTLNGRVVVPMKLGDFQRDLMVVGAPKEAELLRRRKRWYFNLVLEIPDPEPSDGYFAGHFDGEGCVYMSSPGKKRSGALNKLKIQVCVCDLRTLQAYQARFGGTINSRKSIGKPMSTWTMAGVSDCERFIHAVLPHSIEKRGQLDVAQRWLAHRISVGRKSTPETARLANDTTIQLKALKRE